MAFLHLGVSLQQELCKEITREHLPFVPTKELKLRLTAYTLINTQRARGIF
jgi:hypothetical protein